VILGAWFRQTRAGWWGKFVVSHSGQAVLRVGGITCRKNIIRDYSLGFPFWETGMRWSLTIPWQELQI
jgi:hypothetical protein